MREDRRAKLADIFADVSNVYSEIVNELPEFATVKIAQALEEEDKYFASAQGFYKVAVVGSYSTGKTTLLKTLFFDRGLYEVDLPTAADITTQVPTIIKMIPGYMERSHVKAEVITRADFMAALRWMFDQMSKKVNFERPDLDNLTPQGFAAWVDQVAAPTLLQQVRGGTGATQEHYLRELQEAVQIFRTLDPGYRMPMINDISTALAAIKDPKASRTLRSISISIPGRNITYPIQLVDLPGMDVPNLAHRQFSYKFIAEEADAVLFLKDAQKPNFTEGEQELLTHIVSKLFDIQQKCFFIFNKWHDSDHPGAEKAVREVIHNYHFQSRNIFRISALPSLMYLEEQDGIDIEGKYRRSQRDWAVSSFKELKHQFGDRLLHEMGITQLKEFLEYYCENSLPVLALRNHAETICDLLKAMYKRFDDIQIDTDQGVNDIEAFEHPNLAKCKAAIESFKENIHGIESRLDDFADSLQESLAKLTDNSAQFQEAEQRQREQARRENRAIVSSAPSPEPEPVTTSSSPGALTKLLLSVGVIKSRKTEGNNIPDLAPAPIPKKKSSGRDRPKTLQELDVPGGRAKTRQELDKDYDDFDDGDVIFDDEPHEGDIVGDFEAQELVPQRPSDIMSYLLKEVFPTIDVYQRARVIRNYTAGRSKIHSHEIELAVIRDVNKALREKFLEVLVGIVGHHLESLCRTIDNEGYIDHLDTILTQLNLNLYIQPHTLFAKFMEDLKTRLNEACGVMAEMAIKQLDEVGVYNNDLNKVASMSCDSQDEARLKQKHLIDYLRRNYENSLALAFLTLRKEGWDELSEKIAKGRESLVGLMSKHHIISSKIFDERRNLERQGLAFELALFETIEQALMEKMAVLKDIAKEDIEVKVTQRNAKVSEYQQKIQLLTQKCKDILASTE